MTLPDENNKPVPLDIMIIFETMRMAVKPEGQKGNAASELPVRRLVNTILNYFRFKSPEHLRAEFLFLGLYSRMVECYQQMGSLGHNINSC